MVPLASVTQVQLQAYPYVYDYGVSVAVATTSGGTLGAKTAAAAASGVSASFAVPE